MRRAVVVAAVLLVLFVLLATPLPRDALTDDFETDFWLPFTHFHLGDQAHAGYSDRVAHSGLRSYHVEIHGWTVRDFGSAYGYAVFATRGSSLAELRIALLYDSLRDIDPSPWDSYLVGVSLEILDAEYRGVGTYRYVTAYSASANAGRCGPTLSDVILDQDPPLGAWQELARDPGADFPAAPWSLGAYVKVSVGFLCAAGLSGAAYGLYADDFALETNSGDSDGDGLRDLEEETRVYAVELSDGGTPRSLDPGGETSIELVGPRLSGSLAAGAVSVDLVHPRLDDLSVSLVVPNGTVAESHLLWDPGANVRKLAIFEPAAGRSVRSSVRVVGRVAPDISRELCLLVDGREWDVAVADTDGRFGLDWDATRAREGTRLLQVAPANPSGGCEAAPASVPVPVLVDRTPPDLSILSPSSGALVSGLLRVEAAPYDALGVRSVELWMDGARMDVRASEPYVFLYETLDLSNAAHTVEVRADDFAGNVASRSVSISVSNKANVPPPPCYPACNLTSGTTVGNLAPVRADPQTFRIDLASGTRLDVVEGLTVPWRPHVTPTPDGISLVLDLFADGRSGGPEGLVAPHLSTQDLLASGAWRIVVRDYGEGLGGFVERASVRFALRTLPGDPDTDHDGISDGAERAHALVPVIADLDSDGLSDGFESIPHAVTFMIEGVPRSRVIVTSPVDPDMDDDGLTDGAELFPSDGSNATDPLVWDTDGDGLSDGAERLTYGTDATVRDSDGDTLTDGFEVTPRPLTLSANGIEETRSVTTSPLSQDTDGDGLRDPDEWNGAALYGFATDPSDADTDHDGLSDGDEIRGVHRRPTNPVRSDTDGDGLVDSLDEAPLETWEFDWRSSYEPGLVRFTQRVHALDVHGRMAQIWTYDALDNACVFLGDHTADSTLSSDESFGNVASWINKTFLQGGEMNYTITGMRYDMEVGWGFSHYERGACDVLAPRKYIIEYETNDHLYEVDFVNNASVNISDSLGQRLWHTSFDVPLTAGVAETLLFQVVIDAKADVGGPVPGGGVVLPMLQYSLHRTADFYAAPAFFANVAVGAPIDDHAYQVSLRIPRRVLEAGNLSYRDGKGYARLALTPLWVNASGVLPQKTAMNPSALRVGSVIVKTERYAEHIIARLYMDEAEMASFLPSTAENLPTGWYGYGGYSVYVYHLGDPFDADASASANIVWLAGESEDEVANFQSQVTWSPSSTWSRAGLDAFGTTLGIMKIFRRGLSITSALTAQLVPSTALAPTWTWSELTMTRSYTLAATVDDLVTSDPIFVVSASGTSTICTRSYRLDIRYAVTETYTVEWEQGNAEILDDIDDSLLLAERKFSVLKTALKGAAVGATLVIYGSQAVLAFADGDIIKGTMYASAGAVSVFGVVRSDLELSWKVFRGETFGKGIAVKLGTVAAIAAGGIIASYELYRAGSTTNPIEKLSHYETAQSTLIDTLVAVIPLYGAPISMGWQLGIGIAVASQLLLGVMPDVLAARIVSTPGSTAVFLLEYVIGGAIPSAISADALLAVLSDRASFAQYCNNINPPIPTIVVAP